MSTYKINFKQLRQQPQLSEMLLALERGLNKFGIDFYLVGAVARDLWMSAINDIPPSRITGDIDFAIFIDDKGTYDNLKKYLIEVEGFSPYKGNAFVLVWKSVIQVDLLPFGETEDKDAGVTIEGSGLTSLYMPGFKEIYDDGLPIVELEEIHKFKFCTLPGIVILKLMAWQDRPEIRRDDIKDVCNVLKHFFNMYAEEIFENHNDLFGDNPFELHLIAARVMGREMNKIAKRNEILYNRLKALLEGSINNKDISIAKIMAEFYENTIEDNVAILEQIKNGYLE
jgi:predicted nucleotidyltransferase